MGHTTGPVVSAGGFKIGSYATNTEIITSAGAITANVTGNITGNLVGTAYLPMTTGTSTTVTATAGKAYILASSTANDTFVLLAVSTVGIVKLSTA